MVALYKRYTKTDGYAPGEAYQKIADQFARPVSGIRDLIRRFQPSVDGAEAFMKANALKLAMRVVRKANADQAIDILSRTNMGVLAPKQEGGGGQGGFFLSVQAENLGAVRVTAGAMPASPQRFMDLPQPLQMGQGTAQDATSTTSSANAEADETATIDEEREALRGDIEEDVVRVSTPGSVHQNQGTFRRLGLSERQLRDIERNKRKLAEARRLKNLMKNRAIET